MEEEREDDPAVDIAVRCTDKEDNTKEKTGKKKGKRVLKKFSEPVPCGIGKCKVSLIC